MAILVYVYDLLIMRPSLENIVVTKVSLESAFTIKDIGPVKYFLGLEISRFEDGIFLNQHKYIRFNGLQAYKHTSSFSL